LKISGISPNDIKPISKRKLDKVIKAAANTPPLKLKDLKAKLKKEREEKQNILFPYFLPHIK